MARPIKETPVLKGKDAKRFLEARKSNTNNKETPKDKERIIANFNKFNFVQK